MLMPKLFALAAIIGLTTPTAGPIVNEQTNKKVAAENELQKIINTQLANQQTDLATMTGLPNYSPGEPGEHRGNQPFQWYAPSNSTDGTLNAWANDPCTILYDEASHLYYS